MGADLTTGAGTSAGKNGIFFSCVLTRTYNTHTHIQHTAPTHLLWAIKCMTNSNSNPSRVFYPWCVDVSGLGVHLGVFAQGSASDTFCLCLGIKWQKKLAGIENDIKHAEIDRLLAAYFLSVPKRKQSLDFTFSFLIFGDSDANSK